MVSVIIIFLLFAFIHSVTVSKKFKQFCKDLFGETFMRVFYRSVYIAVSVLTSALALFLLAQEPDQKIWTAPAVLRWTMYVIQLAGLAFGALAFEHLDAGEFLGVKQIVRYLAHREVAGNIEGLTQKELVTSGVYGIVRHPIYLAGIIIFTFNPHLTVNSFLLTVLADLYFLFGAFIEERRFLEIFGHQYREYMQRVPRLFPRISRRISR